jgi:hypothetical protein
MRGTRHASSIRMLRKLYAIVVCAMMALCASTIAWAAPLPSWNDGPEKRAILAFVTRVTTPGSPDFVPVAERVAVFDNDGTLWTEMPASAQLFFAMDRAKALAPRHPEWRTREPFKSALAGDAAGVAKGGERGIVELLAATHTGMTATDFTRIVEEWLATARHPRFQRRYTELVYQPMLEVLEHFRAHGFKTYIVSGGGVEFMRPFSQPVYGVPPEQVIGSFVKLKFELQDGRPVLMRLPEVAFVDDKEGKPIAIHQVIGRRPIAAFGNSDGDLQMLQYTAGGAGARLMVLVNHTDAAREYAYDKSPASTLDKALAAAKVNDWHVVDMKTDWRVVFPAREPSR